MRRGLRGLLIVLGMLWVAAAADASTILIGDSSIELPSFVAHEVSEIPGGASVRQTEVSTPGTRTWVRAGGNPRFGRRDFIWHPSPVVPPSYRLPVPPPPPNQIIHVVPAKPLKMDRMWEPYWVIGTLETSLVENDLATSAYAMRADEVLLYEE